MTDPSNASRTMLFDISRGSWDPQLLELFGVPERALPKVATSCGELGETRPGALHGHSVPVAGVAGDQQAALFGQACVDPGEGKTTYGTGSFALQNAGYRAPRPVPGLLATVAWAIGPQLQYALEAAIFVTGAAVQWLRDGLGIIASAGETEELARAALESIAYQTVDAIRAMESASGQELEELRADGGATQNAWLMQFQADALGVPVVVPEVAETTALGAAYLAGVGIGMWTVEQVSKGWRERARYEPAMSADQRESLLHDWRRA